MKLSILLDTFDKVAPLATAEEWDNVGLLLGDRTMEVDRAMTCLTVCDSTVQEAIDGKADLIISHHPLPFKPQTRITTDHPTGRYIWKLASHKVAIYSPHTAWDNATNGINQRLAQLIGLSSIRSLKPFTAPAHASSSTFSVGKDNPSGMGRVGDAPSMSTIESIVTSLSKHLPFIDCATTVPANCTVNRVALICGSGGSLAKLAANADADLLITGEATYHQALEATAIGIQLLTIGHFASEVFAMTHFADIIRAQHPQLAIWASHCEVDAMRRLRSTESTG